MAETTKGFDLSLLEGDYNLNDIPDFTSTDAIELHELKRKLAEATGEARADISNKIWYLQFIQAADYFRDLVLEDGVVTADEAERVKKALQDYARAVRIKTRVDSY